MKRKQSMYITNEFATTNEHGMYGFDVTGTHYFVDGFGLLEIIARDDEGFWVEFYDVV